MCKIHMNIGFQTLVKFKNFIFTGYILPWDI